MHLDIHHWCINLLQLNILNFIDNLACMLVDLVWCVMNIHILIKTHHPTNLIISCIMCLMEKGRKVLYAFFFAFSQKIWTKENKIINKLCGGVKMECICRYTPRWWPILKGQALFLRSWWWKLRLVHLSGIMSIELINSY